MLKASMSTGRCWLLHVTYTFVVANMGVANIVPALNVIFLSATVLQWKGSSFEEPGQAE
jgi:hypothetical protein